MHFATRSGQGWSQQAQDSGLPGVPTHRNLLPRLPRIFIKWLSGFGFWYDIQLDPGGLKTCNQCTPKSLNEHSSPLELFTPFVSRQQAWKNEPHNAQIQFQISNKKNSPRSKSANQPPWNRGGGLVGNHKKPAPFIHLPLMGPTLAAGYFP